MRYSPVYNRIVFQASIKTGSSLGSGRSGDGALSTHPQKTIKRPTHFRHQSRGQAPLDQPQDIRLSGFAVRDKRSNRRFRFTRAMGP